MDIPTAVQRIRSELPPANNIAADVAVLVVLVAALVAGLVTTGVLQQPTVEGIEKDWGGVSNETTTIETQVEVNNPGSVGIPGVLSLEYTVSMNDVVLTENSKSGVGLSAGSNTIRLSSEMQNSRIADWLVTHVNNDEQSTLTISPAVTVPSVERPLADRTSRIETDLLDSIGGSGRTISFDGDPFLELGEQNATWGTATSEETPLRVETVVENVHDYPVSLTGVEYAVSMNSVTLGSGRTGDDFEVKPGETGMLNVTASLDTQAFADWWPTHVRNNENSRMQLEMFGLVEKNETTERVPLALYQSRLGFQTDLLGSGGTAVDSLPTEDVTANISVPTAGETVNEWGAITQNTSEVISRTPLSGGRGLGQLGDITTLTLDRTTSINNVTIVDAIGRGSTIPAPGEPLVVRTPMDNTKFPQWWPKHINNGEQSSYVAMSQTFTDIGLTRFDVATTNEQRSFETSIVDNLAQANQTSVTAGGETLATVSDRQASWGTATADRTPLSFSAQLQNSHVRPLEFDGIGYTVTMNDVVVANGTDSTTVTVDPGQSRAIPATIPMDTAKLSEWWVDHLRSGEQSIVSAELYGVITQDGERKRVTVALASQRFNMTTDLLGSSDNTFESLPTADGPSIERPTVSETTRAWGAVTDPTTEVVSDIVVDNPNGDAAVNDLLQVGIDSQTTVNDVAFGSGERTRADLSAGQTTVVLTSELDNGAVPSWWAKHINNGESSTVRTNTSGTVDIGLTTLDASVPNSTSTIQTDMLAGFQSEEPQELTADGTTVLTAESSSAQWGTATPEQAPLTAQSMLTNERDLASVTVESIDYVVSINGLSLATGTHHSDTAIPPGTAATVELPLTLDNGEMDEWWATHVPSEESTLRFTADATVSVGGETSTVPLTMFTSNETVTTDILG